jgi:RNA polymerase sigma factor (sigma-70 family)
MSIKTDRELIESYATDRNDAAFAELVARYNPMVYRACLRVLGNAGDAEDATQAAFLVLARKAGSLRQEGRLNGWLHRVARQVALQALRVRADRERRQEHVAVTQEGMTVDTPEVDREVVFQAVDAELDGLSAVLREALVLRYLRGFSEQDAAAQAGCPLGTMKWRASAGIAKLRQRLAKRGIALGGLALVGLLTSEASAAVPETLLPSILATVKTAVATTATATGATSTAAMLAKGAMKAMFWNSVKTAALVAVIVGVVGVATVLTVAEKRASKPVAAAAIIETTNAETTAVNGLKLSLLRVGHDARIEGSVGVARFVLRWENVSREPMAVFFSKRWFDDDSDDDTLRACVLKPGEISETPVRDATVSMHMSVPGLNEYGVQALFAQDTSGAQFSWKRKAIPDSKLATEEPSSSRQFTTTEREKVKNATLWIGKIRSNVIRLDVQAPSSTGEVRSKEYYGTINFAKMDNAEIFRMMKIMVASLNDIPMAKSAYGNIKQERWTDKDRDGFIEWAKGVDEEMTGNACNNMMDPDYGRFALLRFYHGSGIAVDRIKQGLNVSEEVIKMPRYADSAQWLRAELFEMDGKFAEAMECYKISSNEPEKYFRIAEILLRLKQKDQALAELRGVEKFFKESAPRAALRIAYIYQGAKEQAKFIGALRDIMKKYPSYPESNTAHIELERME